MNPTEFKTVASILANHQSKKRELRAEIVAGILEGHIHDALFSAAASKTGATTKSVVIEIDFRGNCCSPEISAFIEKGNNPDFEALCVEIKKRLAASGWSIPECKIWSEYLHGWNSLRMYLDLTETPS